MAESYPGEAADEAQRAADYAARARDRRINSLRAVCDRKIVEQILAWQQSNVSLELNALITKSQNGEEQADVPTFVDTITFTVPGDRTADYVVGRDLRARITSGVCNARILTANFATSVTTITITNETQPLDAGLSKVWLGLTIEERARTDEIIEIWQWLTENRRQSNRTDLWDKVDLDVELDPDWPVWGGWDVNGDIARDPSTNGQRIRALRNGLRPAPTDKPPTR